MLQKIRDNIQGLFAKIFIGFIIAVFALFGVETIVGTFINQQPVTTVNGVEITDFQVTFEAQRKFQELYEMLGDDAADPSLLDEGLVRQMALNDLIQQELMFQAAADSGMAISSVTIDRQIARIPDFQLNGVFNNDLAQAILSSNGMTPSSFRASLRRQALLNQLVVAYSQSAFVTPAEIEQIAALTRQARDIHYTLINQGTDPAEIEITDAEIQQYYQENEAFFMREEQVAIEYLLLDKNDLFAQVEVSEAQIEAQYQQDLANAQASIERRAAHILLEASSDTEIQAARELAEEIKARIDAGESFEDMAAEFSDDLGSAQDGGDVGYTTGTSFVDEFEAALQALAVNEVSGPVVTEFGVHLIKLTELSEAEVPSLEDSRERIIRELSSREVETRYLQQAQTLGNLAFESLDLQEPAAATGLEIQTSTLFGRSGGVGVTSNPRVIEQAFSLDVLEGLNSDLVALDDSRSLVLRVIDHRQPELRSLDEVRGEIDITLRTERLRRMVEQRGRDIVDALREGQDPETLMAEHNLVWSNLPGLRRDSFILERELVENVFRMAYPQDDMPNIRGFLLNNGSYAVVQLDRVVPGSTEGVAPEEMQAMRNFVTQQGGTADFNAFLGSLRANANIKGADAAAMRGDDFDDFDF